MSILPEERSVAFVNRFYAPDFSATSQMLTDLAQALVGKGWRVTVLASRQVYDDPEHRLPLDEVIKGVNVVRVRTTHFGRGTMLGRMSDYLSFYLSAFFMIRRLAKNHDVIVAKTDPPLISVVAMLACAGKRARLVNWLQDVYPEVAAAAGIKVARGWPGRLIGRLRDQSLRRAEQNVAIGSVMADHLIDLGIDGRAITVIPNWADDRAIQPNMAGGAELRRVWDYSENWFIVGYSGNLGQAHDVDTILNAAEILRDEQNIRFLFIGGGKQLADLKKEVSQRSLSSFLFQPYQPRSKLGQSLAVPDVHWLSLRPEMEGLIVPSKVYGIAAAGKAMIAVGAEDGEIGRLLKQADCGVSVAPGDAEAFAAAVRCLYYDHVKAEHFGKNARAWIERHGSAELRWSEWNQTLLSARISHKA